MAYSFQLTNRSLSGHTLPASAYIRIFDTDLQQYVATFDASSYSPEKPWLNTTSALTKQELELLLPQVLAAACQRVGCIIHN